jgi:hypothetical protein
MLLSEGNNVYLSIRPGVEVKPGQKLTLYGSGRPLRKVEGARMPPGRIVPVKGTVQVDRWDSSARIARGTVIESVDIIERGAKVGAVGRRLEVVPPRANKVNLRARVLTSTLPHVYMAAQQVVFIDRGSDDGLKNGNRLFVVRRGDTWRRSLQDTPGMARDRLRLDVPDHVEVETTPLHGDEKRFPDEVIAELRVLRTNRFSSVAMVTNSRVEVVSGDRAIARKGY